MHYRYVAWITLCTILLINSSLNLVFAQEAVQSEGTPLQRFQVMQSRLDGMHRSLSGAISGLEKTKADKNSSSEDARSRLRGLDKEVSSLQKELGELRGKHERAEKYDQSDIGRLESAVSDLNNRVEAGLRETANVRRAIPAATASTNSNKNKPGFFGRMLGRGGDDKYEDLVGVVAPGRDRQLVLDAAKEARKSNYDASRMLFSTIISAYPDSNYLPLSKLAIADTYYLEGSTSSLIQAGAAYRDWLAFFPTDPLAPAVMLKIAEVEMRQMGLPDRDYTHAAKAEHQLKATLQRYPRAAIRPEIEKRLIEVQENLGMHSLYIGEFYHNKSLRQNGGLKGAQNRFREIVEKYPNFSHMDRVLFRLATTYLQEEEPDEAAKHFQRILRDFPNSEYAKEAREQLQIIGAFIPSADPRRQNQQKPKQPALISKVLRQVTGSAQVTINKNGILISKDDKKNSLIDMAIQNNGVLSADPTAGGQYSQSRIQSNTGKE
jgi:outer membrane protein assembly factor BamD